VIQIAEQRNQVAHAADFRRGDRSPLARIDDARPQDLPQTAMVEIGRNRVGENSLDGLFQFRLIRAVLGLAPGTRGLLDDGTPDCLEQRRPRVVDFSIDLCAGANLHGNHFCVGSGYERMQMVGRCHPLN
jgi:hypothetical protein